MIAAQNNRRSPNPSSMAGISRHHAARHCDGEAHGVVVQELLGDHPRNRRGHCRRDPFCAQEVEARRRHRVARVSRRSELGGSTASKSDLARIYKYAIDFSGCSIVWYQSRRQPKRVAGFLLRVAALVATFGAGLVPLAEDITPYTIEPQVSTLLLALAGLFVAIDNLGGYTSGWVRYMLAQQKIERARDTFFMEWNFHAAWLIRSQGHAREGQGLPVVRRQDRR